jgi:long-subunit fatty acid transport protein
MIRPTLRALAFVSVLSVVGSAAAWTADPLFRSWEWVAEPQSARATALAGAVAAEPSDASSALLFPAGLSLVSETDLRVTIRYSASGSLNADPVSAQWAPGEVAFALPVGLRWGVGAYYRDGRQLDLDFQNAPLPDGSFDEGRLGVESHEAGVAVGFAAWPSLRVGARLGLARLDLSGSVRSTAPSGAVSTVGSSVKDDAARLGAGVLFAPEQRVQVGLEYDSKVSWSGPSLGPAGAPPGELVSPARLSLGVLYRPSTAVQFLAQVDRVGWSAAEEAVRCCAGGPNPDALSLDDATDVRFGLELRPEYGNIGIWNRVALRVGLQFRSRGRLESVDGDPAQEARFPGAGHATEWSVGLAYWRFEVSWIGRKPSNVWVFGVRQPF